MKIEGKKQARRPENPDFVYTLNIWVQFNVYLLSNQYFLLLIGFGNLSSYQSYIEYVQKDEGYKKYKNTLTLTLKVLFLNFDTRDNLWRQKHEYFKFSFENWVIDVAF